MKYLDRLLQRIRISKVKKYLNPGDTVLDIGTADGSLFKQIDYLGQGSVGIDPNLDETIVNPDYQFIAGTFPKDMDQNREKAFDAITMLAVLEHIPESGYESLLDGCNRYLKPSGLVLITVPAPIVDTILAVLFKLRLIDGMELEEHHHFNIEKTLEIFPGSFYKLVCREKFELGMNNLFVFEKL